MPGAMKIRASRVTKDPRARRAYRHTIHARPWDCGPTERPKDLRKRLRAKKLGGGERYAGYGTALCPDCKHQAIVTHAAPGQYRRIRSLHCGLRDKIACR